MYIQNQIVLLKQIGMLEVETETLKETAFFVEYVDQLENSIKEQYPQLVLPSPLDDVSVLNRKSTMNSNERQFAKLLLSKDMVVYREPRIQLCDSVPDFFVYNPRTFNGKLVEITLSPMRTNDDRKRRQIRNLELCGIPFVVLFREHMQNIRQYCWNELF